MVDIPQHAAGRQTHDRVRLIGAIPPDEGARADDLHLGDRCPTEHLEPHRPILSVDAEAVAGRRLGQRVPFPPVREQLAMGDDSDGRAPYFVQYVGREAAALDTLGGTALSRSKQVYTGGYTIETTLDPKALDTAVNAVRPAQDRGHLADAIAERHQPVRDLQMELFAASLSNVALREEFVPRFLGWRAVVGAAVRDAIAYYRIEFPVSAEAITCWIIDFWTGMEFEMLLGIEEHVAHHEEALDLMQLLLERLDAEASLPEQSTAGIQPPDGGA